MKQWISGQVGEGRFEVRVAQGPNVVLHSHLHGTRTVLGPHEARMLIRALEDGVRIAEGRDKQTRDAYLAARKGEGVVK